MGLEPIPKRLFSFLPTHEPLKKHKSQEKQTTALSNAEKSSKSL
jgi:hypothetical protein